MCLQAREGEGKKEQVGGAGRHVGVAGRHVGGVGRHVGGVVYEYNIKSYRTHKGLILMCQEHYIPYCVY